MTREIESLRLEVWACRFRILGFRVYGLRVPGYIGNILGLYRDNGKENGNNLGFRV